MLNIFILLVCISARIVLFHTGSVCGGCSLTGAIGYLDREAVLSVNELLCEISMASPDERQVVAVIYDVVADCTTKGKIEIFDGIGENKTLIVEICKGSPTSYISRKNGLVIKPLAPYKPFSIDIQLLDTDVTYETPKGFIGSARYLGYISGDGGKLTTPNNLLAVYRIKAEANVTMKVDFLQFQTELGSNCSYDYLQVVQQGIPRICGSQKPASIIATTNELIIKFVTNNDNAYRGFTAQFEACVKEDLGYNLAGQFEFPLMKLAGRAVSCLYRFRLRGRMKLIFYLTFGSNRTCTDVVKVVSEDLDITSEILKGCSPSASFSFIVQTNDLKLIFSSVSSTETLRGNYIIVSDHNSDIQITTTTTNNVTLASSTQQLITEEITSSLMPGEFSTRSFSASQGYRGTSEIPANIKPKDLPSEKEENDDEIKLHMILLITISASLFTLLLVALTAIICLCKRKGSRKKSLQSSNRSRPSGSNTYETMEIPIQASIPPVVPRKGTQNFAYTSLENESNATHNKDCGRAILTDGGNCENRSQQDKKDLKRVSKTATAANASVYDEI